VTRIPRPAPCGAGSHAFKCQEQHTFQPPEGTPGAAVLLPLSPTLKASTRNWMWLAWSHGADLVSGGSSSSVLDVHFGKRLQTQSNFLLGKVPHAPGRLVHTAGAMPASLPSSYPRDGQLCRCPPSGPAPTVNTRRGVRSAESRSLHPLSASAGRGASQSTSLQSKPGHYKSTQDRAAKARLSRNGPAGSR
jgi:hypothetical protein